MIDLSHSLEDLGRSFEVRVTPKAANNRVRIDVREDGSQLIRVYVTVAAEDGKANRQVIKLLAKELGLPPSRLAIVRGKTSRNKVIEIKD